jgi:radical SAM protein with 4Fe4S-binding SPASM domain
MYDLHTYRSELQNELSLYQCVQILDDFKKTIREAGIQGHISFCGGDVFLNESTFWTLVEMSKDDRISFSVLGNPDLLTHEKAVRLRDLGIQHYQISIDGLEKSHDSLRRPGSFRKSIWALCLLESLGIRTSVMFTISPANAGDLVSIMRLLGNFGITNFCFDRVVSLGNWLQLGQDTTFTSQQYRNICEIYLKERSTLNHLGISTNYTIKSHLLKLYLYDLGRLGLNATEGQDYGCPVGRSAIAILADGTVLPCRRLPIVIGKLPQQSLIDVIARSDVLMRFRQQSNYEKCKDCDLFYCCRGCPAVAYSVAGNPFAPDPHCWK